MSEQKTDQTPDTPTGVTTDEEQVDTSKQKHTKRNIPWFVISLASFAIIYLLEPYAQESLFVIPVIGLGVMVFAFFALYKVFIKFGDRMQEMQERALAARESQAGQTADGTRINLQKQPKK